MKDIRIKEGDRSKGGLNEMPTAPRPKKPKPMGVKKNGTGGKKMPDLKIEEGPVTISFEDSNRKQKITFVVDFGETDLTPTEAATIFKSVVQVLREGLGVSLSKCQ